MTNDDPQTRRSQWQSELFPEGIPTLWCPPLTHYTPDGRIDRVRIAAHLKFISPWVKGLLVPGTTGDGWELTADETREVTDVVLEEVRRLNLHLLLGALTPDAARAAQLIREGLTRLQQRAGTDDVRRALDFNRVCGLAVCPPRGAEVTQPEMEAALAGILELGLPVALYQLPQVTQNEMSPELVATLARRFPNFILLKDTSGGDRVAASGLDFGGVFLVRGMEGAYARWLKLGGGCYDGWLLSAANAFAEPLHQLREGLAASRREAAQGLSDRLSHAVEELFRIVAAVPGGNPFANANKLADHYYAHGPRAATVPPPRLHSGHGLTTEMVRAAGETLQRHELMPARGYLE